MKKSLFLLKDTVIRRGAADLTDECGALIHFNMSHNIKQIIQSHKGGLASAARPICELQGPSHLLWERDQGQMSGDKLKCNDCW